MASLQEQLLQAGIVDKKKARQIDKEKRKAARSQPKGPAKVDETRELAQRALADKAERARELNRQQQAQAEQKAIQAQVIQLIRMNRIEHGAGDVPYQFTDGKKIKKKYVSAKVHEELTQGRVAIARLGERYELLPAAAARKIKDTRNAPEATKDAAEQLQRLLPKNFLAVTPWSALQHFPRYLKAIQLRLDKLRADPARDAQRMAEARAQEQRFWRLVAERKGQQDARLQELRWLLEELRVSFFAQELRTPQPVSVKRLEKVWGQVGH